MSKHQPLWWTHYPVGAGALADSKWRHTDPDLAEHRKARARYLKAAAKDSGEADRKLRKFSWESGE